ncbi:hypothetical protein [Comamonas kerstersii]|uniref:hypothetical protein n=3 Tax=Comamonas kerstersii TaxID=225992 RepID=UPI00345DCF78
MSCNQGTQNDPHGWLGDVSSSALDGLDAHIDDLKARGLTPSIIGKAGGPVGDVYDIYQIGKAAMEGGWTPALVKTSSALGGIAGAAAAGALVIAFLPAGAAVGAVAMIAIGAGSFAGGEIGEALGEFLFDPTLEPEFYEETLRNRERRLRDRGIDPETDPGTQNIRRQLEKARRRAGIPSPSDCPMEDIKEKTRTASTIPSPIILDLDGDGVIRTVGLSSGVNFDHAADGFAERTGWVAPGDGLLVWDRNASGTIDSGRELFGSETLLPNGMKAINGFEALKAFDVNGDGVIDANDPVFAQLRVWVDADTNARTGEGELLTLEEARVKSVNLAYTNSNFVDAQGNAHRQVGSYTTTDGQTRAATDVWFTSDVTNSLPTDWVEVPKDIAALPDAQGYGKVRDLRQAMAANDRRWSLIA